MEKVLVKARFVDAEREDADGYIKIGDNVRYFKIKYIVSKEVYEKYRDKFKAIEDRLEIENG